MSKDQITISHTGPRIVLDPLDSGDVKLTVGDATVILPHGDLDLVANALTVLDTEAETSGEPAAGDWREEMQTRDGGGETCPECGEAELVSALGAAKACPSCGYVQR